MPRPTASPVKLEIYRFHPAVLILTPLLALVAQTYLPLHINFGNWLDLPLLVIIYFGLTRRSPVEGLLLGAVIGMAQDGLSRGPIGFLGTAKTVIGYVTTFVSVRFTAENRGVRCITIFVFYYIQFILLYLITALLLGQPMELEWLRRFLAGLVNVAVGVLIFELLDRFRKPA